MRRKCGEKENDLVWAKREREMGLCAWHGIGERRGTIDCGGPTTPCGMWTRILTASKPRWTPLEHSRGAVYFVSFGVCDTTVSINMTRTAHVSSCGGWCQIHAAYKSQWTRKSHCACTGTRSMSPEWRYRVGGVFERWNAVRWLDRDSLELDWKVGVVS